ncbi:succinate-acetate/proton symporter SatP [Anaerotignum neopropionicum]|uniref:Succinate-acetate/proton symporter SatP n=1 Tax=Anaerotignum neopropionicum TaxID=36847 RepID=A0A136WEW5_9FIRM|nr:GPR1/FUN34/YaaH family transporter [Anaerotignum neopropionicum]KXL53082.1 succinate-acetate/proton symporter SatP [Anaerotignum neopropionicum]
MSSQKSNVANPAPLGLLGFGMTTILLNLHNAGIISLSAVIISMGLCLGGFAQVVAGVMEFKAGNTFGATAFTAYGTFWWSLVGIWLLPSVIAQGGMQAGDEISMGFYLLLWGIFTLGMFIGTFKHNMATRVVFGSLTLLFFLLSLGDFTGSHFIKTIAGYEGIFCGGSAIYSALGQIINNEFQKDILKL